MDTCPAFETFLDCLGTRIPLKGFQGYAGGLDTKTDTTGTHSVHTTHQGFEVMFHVSTMLPYFPKDEQQVERKRHLGNDVVVIIFKESADDSFSPQNMASQFNRRDSHS